MRNNSGLDGCQSDTELLQKFTMVYVKPWKEYGGDIPEPVRTSSKLNVCIPKSLCRPMSKRAAANVSLNQHCL